MSSEILLVSDFCPGRPRLTLSDYYQPISYTAGTISLAAVPLQAGIACIFLCISGET